MGDLNCDLLPDSVNINSSHLLNIMDIYGLTQLITEPTRVTQYSRTLIDLCLTNPPDKISNSGIVDIGISDHCAIFLTFLHRPQAREKALGTRLCYYVRIKTAI